MSKLGTWNVSRLNVLIHERMYRYTSQTILSCDVEDWICVRHSKLRNIGGKGVGNSSQNCAFHFETFILCVFLRCRLVQTIDSIDNRNGSFTTLNLERSILIVYFNKPIRCTVERGSGWLVSFEPF